MKLMHRLVILNYLWWKSNRGGVNYLKFDALEEAYQSFLGWLILNTVTSVCKFSILFSVHSLWYYKKTLFNNQVPHGFVIISFILLTLLFDSGVILLGESRFLSLWGVKGFIRKFVAARRKVVNQILRV